MHLIQTFQRSTGILVLWLLIGSVPLFGDFTPMGQFNYRLPNGQDFIAAGPDASVSSFEAQQALAGFERQNAVAGITAMYTVNKNLTQSTLNALQDVENSRHRSDSAGAQSATARALAQFKQLVANRTFQSIGPLLTHTGPNKPIGDLANAFFKYILDLQQSVNNAQAVAAQIDAYIKSNQAGTSVLAAAQHYDSWLYIKGMQCSDLVIMACHNAGVDPSLVADKGLTMTQTWFAHGMGPEFREIAGGDNGVDLGQLAADEGAGRISLPLGSVIVANGHAALFNGVIMVSGQWQLITYDANDAVGWTVSLEGTPSKDDPQDKLLSFPGHQVGDHVTRLQWGLDHLVKVFQPIGNHPGGLVMLPVGSAADLEHFFPTPGPKLTGNINLYIMGRTESALTSDRKLASERK